jgi:hypothetical protein
MIPITDDNPVTLKPVVTVALIPFFKHRDRALQNPFGADPRH